MKLFGTFSGVFVPSFEAILGAVLFLILPALVGLMGLVDMLIIVTLANTATLATAFSIADSATNLERVGPGGMFAVSKRSLGRAFGGSIGIQLYLAQAVSIGFYCTGFAEPLQAYIVQIPAVAELTASLGLPVLVQKQFIATVIAILAFSAAIAGANFISKIQIVIFVILTVAVGVILASPFLGIGGPDGAPIFRNEMNISGFGTRLAFWAAFATFFPAVTGIDAGVGMSGVLKDPRRSLVRGTFLSIGVTYVVYIGITFVFSFVRRDMVIGSGGNLSVIDLFSNSPVATAILLAGILFATGSSALSYFVTAPRTAQALAHENILPKALGFLGRDFSSGGTEPRWATILTFSIVVPVIWAGDISFVSLIVGVCFLVVYGWVNLAAFLERVSGNPSFRPTSKGHWAIGLFGFAVCMMVIALFNIWVGIGVITSQLLVFYLLLRYKAESRLEGVWWGLLFSMLTWGFRRMHRIIQGTKNWRPIVGVFVFADFREEQEATRETLAMAKRLIEYKGLTMVNVLTAAPPPARIEPGAEPREAAAGDVDDASVGAEGGRPPSMSGNTGEPSAAGGEPAAAGGDRAARAPDAPPDVPQTMRPAPDTADARVGRRLRSARVDPAMIERARLVHVDDSDYDVAVRAIVQATVPGGFQINTVLMPVNRRLSMVDLVEQMIALRKNVILYKHGNPGGSLRVDVYWKGEENGNLMAILAYIVSQADAASGKRNAIRLIRKMFNGEDAQSAKADLEKLLVGARLKGETLVLDQDENSFVETVRHTSSDADLIFMGVPGGRASGLSRLFSLDKRAFSRQFDEYSDMPPILFVKAAGVHQLLE